jgi:hypothetical protein
MSPLQCRYCKTAQWRQQAHSTVADFFVASRVADPRRSTREDAGEDPEVNFRDLSWGRAPCKMVEIEGPSSYRAGKFPRFRCLTVRECRSLGK